MSIAIPLELTGKKLEAQGQGLIIHHFEAAYRHFDDFNGVKRNKIVSRSPELSVDIEPRWISITSSLLTVNVEW